MSLLRWLPVCLLQFAKSLMAHISANRMHLDAKKQPVSLMGLGCCRRNGKRVKVNFLSRNKNNESWIVIFCNELAILFWENPHFLGKKTFALLFAFLFVEFEFSFSPLKCFIYFKHRSFCSGIVVKVYAIEKAHFLSVTKIFLHLQSFYV